MPRVAGSSPKPLRSFWVPPSTSAAEPAVPAKPAKPEKPVRVMWTPEQLGFSKRQEYGVDGVSWSSTSDVPAPFGGTVTAIWYGRPITAVSVHDFQGHHATATLPWVVHPDGLAFCETCDWHNLGNPRTCPAAQFVWKLLTERNDPPF